MPMTSREMVSLLLRNGFVEIKCGNGSHRKLYNKRLNRIIIVPYHNRELGKGLEQAILKEAGLK